MKNIAWSRRLLLGCAAAVMMLTAGDSALTQVVHSDIGVDPLEILSQTISPNVALIVDTSGSMGAPFNSVDAGGNNPALGGDDFSSKLYQAKKALKTVIAANAGVANFGLLSYEALNASKDIVNENTDRYVHYVTNQTTAAYWTGNNDKAGIDTTADFFGTTVTANTGTSASNVYGSFARFQYVLDQGTSGYNCTNLAQCRWFLSSAYVRSNVRYTWTSKSPAAMTETTIDCSTDANRAPLGLFPDEPHTLDATKTDYARPCVQMQFGTGAVTTFWYSSVAFENVSQCGGAALISAVPGCMDNDPEDVIDALKLQLPVDGSCQNKSGATTPAGAPCGITPTGAGEAATTIHNTNPALDPNAMEGLLAGGLTPLRASLAWVDTNRATVFANQVTGQPNFVILLTDGVDSCSATTAQIAAAAASLYGHGITVFVVAMGINSTVVDAVANAGSGGQYDAFSAQNPQELVNVLSSIINQTAQTGEFSGQGVAEASVFEFGAAFGITGANPAGVDPFDGNLASPTYRYAKLVHVLYQSTFQMPGFVGHLKAFINTQATPIWEAGDKLCQQVTGSGADTTIVPAKCAATGAFGGVAGNADFATLTGTATPPDFIPNGRLKRRIFTTSSNGVFPYAAGVTASGRQQLVPLWPPTTSDPGVDPDYVNSTKIYPMGVLDVALGIASMDLATLQSTFKACLGGTLPTQCTSTNPATVLSRARKEAREMILAYAAGAVVATSGGLPTRASGEILYKPKGWMLAEGTLSSAVVATQPLKKSPPTDFHGHEYGLYRDGTVTASNQIPLGYGLRSPVSNKPRMSVVYYGANDMLHAFRAGPCNDTAKGCVANETGGEELWGFVPFDQLSKLMPMLVEGQDRANHKYVIASALRVADVFVPGVVTDPNGKARDGKWRTYLFFGRGIAGKHYTALDVTSPGAFTTPALQTAPPLAVWSRGNPDTQDGFPPTPAGSPTNANYLTNTAHVDLGVDDLEAYATMGQTWSTPALARVHPENSDDPPSPLNEGLELMLYSGSGYSSVATEGHSFYSINPLTGDIITRADVGSNASSVIPNAIAAPVAVFNPGQLVVKVGHPAATVGTRVYVGDLHGRLWKFDTDDPGTAIELWDFGVQQPIGQAVALLNYDGTCGNPLATDRKPHIYVETGDDRRVPTPPAEPADFLIAAVRDEETTTSPIATLLFSRVLPERFRGTNQPLTYLTSTLDGAAARVIYSVTRFNQVTSTTCASSFDTRWYLLTACLGQGDATDLTGVLDEPYLPPVHGDPGDDPSPSPPEVRDRLKPETLPTPPPPSPGQTVGSETVFVTAVNGGGSPVCR